MLQINVTSQDAALLVFINLGWLMAEEGSHAEEGSGGGGGKEAAPPASKSLLG